MKTIQDVEQEWEPQPNTVALTTFVYGDKTCTVSTAQLSQAPYPSFNALITALGDTLMNNDGETDKDYETMLFIDGTSTGEDIDALLPRFQGTSSNELQGIFQRYATWEEAKAGHETFLAQVKALIQDEQEGLL